MSPSYKALTLHERSYTHVYGVQVCWKTSLPANVPLFHVAISRFDWSTAAQRAQQKTSNSHSFIFYILSTYLVWTLSAHCENHKRSKPGGARPSRAIRNVYVQQQQQQQQQQQVLDNTAKHSRHKQKIDNVETPTLSRQGIRCLLYTSPSPRD